ncbi:MAG: helix-turn-helix transcriptional regulator [Candidatus Eisenbacteria bacterium]|nr:helix-turn-helix transcriptional regulator [Candidatus Eisenbacteria bacterium]
MTYPLGRRRRVKHIGFYCIGPTVTPVRIEAYQRNLRRSRWLDRVRQHLFLLGARRLDILYLLTRESELCVCDLADILGATVSAVSHQLRILRQHGQVRSRRDGQTIFYSLTGRAATLVRNQERAYGHV